MVFTGKVALITGAARGQGRSHALRLAQLGADLVLCDLCAEIESVPYPQATPEDLETTVREATAAGASVLAEQVDVRDGAGMAALAERALNTFGHVDVVVCNAGIIHLKQATEITSQDWADVIDTNLTGTWNTIRPLLRPMIDRGQGGAIVITSSAAGVKGLAHMAHYAASKSGLIGLARALAVELGGHGIRVNCVAPTTVDTPMAHWAGAYRLFRPDLQSPTRADVEPAFAALNALPVPWVEAAEVTEAVVWLASDEARHVTGIVLPVDAGMLVR